MERQHQPAQLSFLQPEDAELVQLMRRFLAEATRIYELRTGRSAENVLTITSPQDAHDYLAPEMAGLDQEQLRVLNLSIKNQVLSAPMVYQGSVNTAQVRVAEVLRPAVMENAPCVIVAHNHPSGDPTPSSEDVHLTRQIVEAGRLLDIDVLDHIVIGHSGFSSLRERGLGFS